MTSSTTDLPTISIGIVTYGRLEMALRTINSTCKNLIYPREFRKWYVGDDGSPIKEHNKVLSALYDNAESVMGSHDERMRPEGMEKTYFSGKGWNKTLGICHQASDFVLWLEDDWELEEPFDLVPYVRLLQEREDVGLVSFRILSVGCDVHTVGHDGLHYLRYERTTQYAYSGNPSLRHARMTRHYGWFAENVNPGGIELAYDDKYRLDVNGGPTIWRPTSIDPWGAWHHIGDKKSWK